jgi:biopolymer transport protein ExbB/TolQ
MQAFDALERMFQISLVLGVLGMVAYVLIGRIYFKRKRKRYWSGSSLGNALQQLQSIARPSIEHQIEEKLKQKKEEDDDGGPDDPATYIRRLREKIDKQHQEQNGKSGH